MNLSDSPRSYAGLGLDHHCTLQWRHNGCHGVSNHNPHHCLPICLFSRKSKKTTKLCIIGPCAGNSLVTVNSPHKEPVTRKMFPFDDVIIVAKKLTLSWANFCQRVQDIMTTGLGMNSIKGLKLRMISNIVFRWIMSRKWRTGLLNIIWHFECEGSLLSFYGSWQTRVWRLWISTKVVDLVLFQYKTVFPCMGLPSQR